MTASTADPAGQQVARGPTLAQRYYSVHPFYRVSLRWVLIAATTGVAFRESLAKLAEITRHDSLGSYVWTVAVAAILVAAAIARRRRTELPIHDRQTDIIVGIMGMGLALLIQAVLLPRYALYFLLLRLDLVAMWFFVASATVLLFGLRPVIRFAWVWTMLLMVFPLPYFLFVIALGGGKTAAGVGTLLIAAMGTGVAVGRTRRRGAVGSLAAWVVGFAILGVVAVVFPDAPLLVYQQVPALATLCLVSGSFYYFARRGRPKRVLERKVVALAAKQVWAGVPLVVVIALALSQFQLPTSIISTIYPRPSPNPLVQGMPMVIPPGWSTQHTEGFPVNRLFGTGAVVVRQEVAADVGNPRWDKFARPRTVVVDSIVSERPFSFRTYPDRVLYGLTAARISEGRPVDLGMGVVGTLLSVVDDNLLVTWNALQFAWGDDDLAQRVMIFAVDNHEPDAPFPEPTQNVFPTISTLLTLLFRGNDVLDLRTPVFKDAELLTEFGRSLVAAQAGHTQ